MKRVVYFAAFVFAVMLISTNVRAQSGKAMMEGRGVLKGKAAIACNVEHDIWIERKFDLADKYLMPNFLNHHTNQGDTVGIEGHKAYLAKSPIPKQMSGCPAATVVMENGDYVLFLRHSQTPDPQDKTKVVNHLHLDLWRFQGNKMAEHWD